MTSNFNNNTVLSYISNTFLNWKIDKVTPQVLAKAKQNKPQVCYPIKMLLIKLCFLHILDYDYDLKQIGLNFDQSEEQEIEAIILAHLSQCQCPYLLKRQQQNEYEKNESISQQIENQRYLHYNRSIIIVGINFQSSRSMLVCCGWLMAVSNYFNRISQKKLKGILNYRNNNQNPIDRNGIVSNIRNCFEQVMKTPALSKNQSQKFKAITEVYKVINLHRARINNLGKKAFRLSNTLKEYTKRPLNQMKNGVNQSLLMDPLPKHLQDEFVNIMKNQMEGMRNRQYFWQWLNISVGSQTKYVKEHQLFDHQPTKIQQFHQQIIIDRGYLGTFTEKCSLFQDKIFQLNRRCELLMDKADQRQELQKKQMGRQFAKAGSKVKKQGTNNIILLY